MLNDENIIITDDQDNNDVIFDISDRIFELRDQVSLDIISRNILEMFDAPKNYDTTNYVTKFKEKYHILREREDFAGDVEILNNSLQELTQLVLTNLNVKYHVGLGLDIDDDLVIDIDDYLNNVETLYNFFVVRHYSNIKDYFKSKLLQNKINFIEKYKMALDDKTYDDLFLNQDKKKFNDVSDAVIVHFITDIIDDIRSEITSGFEFFKEIVNLDLYEEFNNRMNEMIENYGNELVILDDHKAAKEYLAILDNDEISVTLRNDLLSMFLADIVLSD